MSAANLIHRLMDTVVATEFDPDHPDLDFADAAVALLALAISKLSAAEREDTLQGIEYGALRQAVQEFPQQIQRWH